MVTGDGKPDNIQTIEPTWTLIIILIAIIAILVIISFIILFIKQRQINNLQEQLNKGISTEEINLLLKYRDLNDHDKALIDTMLKTVSQNIQPKE